MATAGTVGATGNPDIDGVLSGVRWIGTITYSFPDSASDYGANYGYGEPTAPGFAQISAAQQTAVNSAMALIMSYTNIDIQFAGTNGADIKLAQSSEANPTAYAYYPGNYEEGGDVWFGNSYNYTNPRLGDYYYITHIHELGHSFGLKHSQETGGPGNVAVPSIHDALEFSVMSYRSYVGGPTSGGYTNEQFGYPQTFMMNDILALQTMYGADYTTNSGNSVYTFSLTTGEMFINGAGQGQPGGGTGGAAANRVFRTVWDGGGNDTYDLSNYTNGMTINLNPGAFSITSSAQLAYLGNGHYAQGNIYNAYLFNNDARSYIENAIGGSGNDSITGNAVANTLNGGAGNDTMIGGTGNDTYYVDSLSDFVTENPGEGTDTLITTVTGYRLGDNVENGTVGTTTGLNLIGNGQDNVIAGNSGNDFLQAAQGNDFVYGLGGNDTIYGGAGNDTIDGGADNDILDGKAGNDTFVFRAVEANGDIIVDFAGNGTGAGDQFLFFGYGTLAQGASFVQLNSTDWQINSFDGLVHDVITLSNAALVDPTDFQFL